MPLISSKYKPPSWLYRSGHVQTIYRAVLREVPSPVYERERIDTADGDFFDIDWSRVGSDRLIVVGHGLEGDTSSNYLTSLIREANRRGWDAVGMNYRGCSGEPNRLARFYHSGATADVHYLLENIMNRDQYRSIGVVGYSLGGNIVCKYSGERDQHFAPIKAFVGVSVPCHLASSSHDIGLWYNKLYLQRFLKSLKGKVRQKEEVLRKVIDVDAALSAKDFFEFDDVCTGPVHGFSGAENYYSRCSSLHFLPAVSVPTLMVNALDDSFLSDQCYPEELARSHADFWLEVPKFGGHVAFVEKRLDGSYWIDHRVMDFIEAQTST